MMCNYCVVSLVRMRIQKATDPHALKESLAMACLGIDRPQAALVHGVKG